MMDVVKKEFIGINEIGRTGKSMSFSELANGDLFLPFNLKFPHTIVWMKLSANTCISVTSNTPADKEWIRIASKEKKVELVYLKKGLEHNW